MVPHAALPMVRASAGVYERSMDMWRRDEVIPHRVDGKMVAITMNHPLRFRWLIWLLLSLLAAACGAGQPSNPAPPTGPAADAAFTEVAHQFLEDLYRRNPTEATGLGIHKYDD